jgi:hypothetical protein
MPNDLPSAIDDNLMLGDKSTTDDTLTSVCATKTGQMTLTIMVLEPDSNVWISLGESDTCLSERNRLDRPNCYSCASPCNVLQIHRAALWSVEKLPSFEERGSTNSGTLL